MRDQYTYFMDTAWSDYDDLLDEDDDFYNDVDDSKSVATGGTSDNSISAASFHVKRENIMSAFKAGYVFETGNSVVAELPVGSTLEVSDSGELTIVSVPEPTYAPGDGFQSKYGSAVVVGMTSQFGKVKAIVSGEKKGFLYVADDTFVVRGQLL